MGWCFIEGTKVKIIIDLQLGDLLLVMLCQEVIVTGFKSVKSCSNNSDLHVMHHLYVYTAKFSCYVLFCYIYIEKCCNCNHASCFEELGCT